MYPSNAWIIDAIALLEDDERRQRFYDAATPLLREQFNRYSRDSVILFNLANEANTTTKELTKDQKQEHADLDRLSRTEVRKMVWLYEQVVPSDNVFSFLPRD